MSQYAPVFLAYKHKITAYKPFAHSPLTPAFTYCGMKSLENLLSNTFLYLLKCKSMQITPRAHLLIQICVQKQFQFKRKRNHSESRQSNKSTPSEPSTKCYKLFVAKQILSTCNFYWIQVIWPTVNFFQGKDIFWSVVFVHWSRYVCKKSFNSSQKAIT